MSRNMFHQSGRWAAVVGFVLVSALSGMMAGCELEFDDDDDFDWDEIFDAIEDELDDEFDN